MRFATACQVSLALGACRSDVAGEEDRFALWMKQGHMTQVDAHRRYLRGQGIDQVVPIWQLVRSGRHWHACHVDEFAVPPAHAWAAIRETLELVRTMREAGLLDGATAVSVYRDAVINTCEGSSRRSRHLVNNAIDFNLRIRSADTDRLCRFWRPRGPSSHFGLGFYDAHRIHVDTSGFRTWGADDTSRTSRCLARR